MVVQNDIETGACIRTWQVHEGAARADVWWHGWVVVLLQQKNSLCIPSAGCWICAIHSMAACRINVEMRCSNDAMPFS